MRLKANDTLHVSSVKAENILPGEEFEVSDDIGRQIAERGLATEVSGEAAATNAELVKADAPPLNKMEAAPANKQRKAK